MLLFCVLVDQSDAPYDSPYFLLPTSHFLLPTSYFLLPTSYFPLPTPYSVLHQRGIN